MSKRQSGKKNSGNTRLKKLAKAVRSGVNRVIKKVSKTPKTIMYDFSRPKSEKGKLTKSVAAPSQPNTPPKRSMWYMGNIRLGRPLSLNKVTSKTTNDGFEVLTLKKGQGKMKRRRSAKRKSRGKSETNQTRRSES